MRINYLLPILCCFFMANSLAAQRYRTAAGLRVGDPFGLTFQQVLWGQNTLEAILTHKPKQNESSFTLLFENHRKILFKRLNYYVGAGPHIGWIDDREGFDNPWGVTFIGGFEFGLKRTVLSWDYKPAVNLSGGRSTIYHHTGISIRYIIVKKKKKKINWKFWQKKDKKKKKKR